MIGKILVLPVILDLARAVVREQPRDVRIGLDRFRQAGADDGGDVAGFQPVVERQLVGVQLELHRPHQRDRARRAVRLGVVHAALDPGDAGEVDAVVVLQQPADDDRRRHGVERHADALAGEVLRLAYLPLVDRDVAVAEHARGEHRDRHHRAVAARRMAEVVRARHLGGVEFEIVRHPVEDLARMVDGEEIEVDAVRLHFAGVQREHAVVEPAGEGDRQS